MKKIDIITTQNVKIEYELANLRDRFLGWLLDIIAIMVIDLILSLFLSIVPGTPGWVYTLALSLPVFFYSLLFEIFNNGQTLGKMALRTKVMTITGKNPEVLDYVIRWSFRMVDIYMTAGALGAILVSASDRAQRMGGVLSNTTVVRLEPRRYLSLDKLLGITTLEGYEPQYPQIRQFSERDMLTIKNTLDRYERYKNPAHREAILLASQRAEEVLGVERGKLGHMNFLRTLIKDYIVLTR